MVAELGGEDRADERSGSGDGGEVMAEGDPFVRRDIILAVLQRMRRSRRIVAQLQHLAREERAV
ncbi:hypothetical protein BN871_AG_00300 [Paenibacillus sp. P22]|nr:hypothetical protein BN871_AG_00300 [Paenibacillus sp. P22]